jgi:thioesterase domain-containing protein
MDVALLCENPATRNRRVLLSRILATQPEGLYNIGGLCIGSILAYEMASQLQAAGHEVSFLVLLRVPSPLT